MCIVSSTAKTKFMSHYFIYFISRLITNMEILNTFLLLSMIILQITLLSLQKTSIDIFTIRKLLRQDRNIILWNQKDGHLSDILKYEKICLNGKHTYVAMYIYTMYNTTKTELMWHYFISRLITNMSIWIKWLMTTTLINTSQHCYLVIATSQWLVWLR